MDKGIKLVRFPVFMAKSFDHYLEIMSEGVDSVKCYLTSLPEAYEIIKKAHSTGNYLQREDGTIFDFEEIDFYYKKLLDLNENFRKKIINDEAQDSIKFQELIMFSLDRMNLRGIQLEYLFYDYTNCDLTKLLECLSEPVCRARMIQAVNVNSAKKGFDESAVEDIYRLKKQPYLTEKQLTWYPKLANYKYKSKEELVKEQNSTSSKKLDTEGFHLA